MMEKKLEVLTLFERIARIKVEENSYRWPPICTGIFHQPKRPENLKGK